MLYLRLLILFFGALLSSAGLASAQSSQKSDQSIARIKSDINQLLAESQLLEKVYLEKQRELNERKKKLLDSQQELISLQEKTSNIQEVYESQEKKVLELNDELRKLEDEVLLKKNKNTFLQGELIDFDEQLRLHKLKLADLQYAKRQVEMDITVARHDDEDRTQKEKDKSEQLNTQLIELLEKEKSLETDLSSIEQSHQTLQSQSLFLAAENKMMKNSFAVWKKEKKFYDQDLKEISKRMAYDEKIFAADLTKKVRLQAEIGAQLSAIQKEYDSVEYDVVKSLRAKEKNIRLTKKIVELDKKNQVLKKKITELEDTLKLMNK